MKFNKGNIYTVKKEFDGKEVCFNYLDETFVVSKFYTKEDKESMADFIKHVKSELVNYYPAEDKKVKIKKTYKGVGDDEIISLSEALDILGGWVIDLSLTKQSLLEGHEQMTSFSYFQKI